ncbi:MAG: ATP-binding cassette domain-containing protein, partial [Gammaproteobacteria bacterium]|nr:ATP-binding cassette domain-containing protein [Gammaproteobacteria bacterium]
VIKDFSMMLEVEEKLAVIGGNGIGKTTFLKCLVGDTELTSGVVKWSENVKIGYYAQDHAADFEEDLSLLDWMTQWKAPSDDEQAVRAVLGRLLFSQKEIGKSVKVLSGGEQGRMLFGKLMLQKPNVLIMDEPTNHLDMESIESLNMALEDYPGTVIFVSHDREFVSSLATRVLVMSENGIEDWRGDYESYLATLDN